MAATLKIRDEHLTTAGDDHVFELEFPTERITVRELIRERVYQEVDDYNRQARLGELPPKFRGLVQPSATEQTLNGPPTTEVREVNWRRQYDLAIDAYERRRMLVLVGDHQTSSLDETIEITAGTEVTFLRLVMLVGG